MFKNILILIPGLFFCLPAGAQQRPLRYYLNADSSSYAGIRLIGQVWMRYNHNNPGTLINGETSDDFFDISVRRLRFQTYARLNEKTNLIMTLGQNNINYLTARSGEIRLLDFYADHQLITTSQSFRTSYNLKNFIGNGCLPGSVIDQF